MTPNSAIAAISKLVAMGRRMKISETFIALPLPSPLDSPPPLLRPTRDRRARHDRLVPPAGAPFASAI